MEEVDDNKWRFWRRRRLLIFDDFGFFRVYKFEENICSQVMMDVLRPDVDVQTRREVKIEYMYKIGYCTFWGDRRSEGGQVLILDDILRAGTRIGSDPRLILD